MKPTDTVNKYVAGSLAGLVATAPMTLVIVLWNRLLPGREVTTMPFEAVTVNIAEKVGVRDKMDTTEEGEAIMFSHFAYGAGCGAMYAEVAQRAPGHPAVKGALFGLLVWTLSYLGWLPAAGILPSATHHPSRSNAFMIVAHLVWGAASGMLLNNWEGKKIE